MIFEINKRLINSNKITEISFIEDYWHKDIVEGKKFTIERSGTLSDIIIYGEKKKLRKSII